MITVIFFRFLLVFFNFAYKILNAIANGFRFLYWFVIRLINICEGGDEGRYKRSRANCSYSYTTEREGRGVLFICIVNIKTKGELSCIAGFNFSLKTEYDGDDLFHKRIFC